MDSDPTGRKIDEAALRDRLDSWKEIAAYLGRDERTVRRWEKAEGLPIRRHVHQKQSSVYAYRSELDVWRDARQPIPDDASPEASVPRESHVGEPVTPAPVSSEPAALEAARPFSLRIRVPAAALSVLVLAVVGYTLASRSPAPAATGRLMLAVLPFENMGPSEYEYFSQGLTEELITEIARLNRERLGVIARTTVLQYRGAPARVRAIGQSLEVSHVVEGSVRMAGDRARITVQLIAVDDESHVWADVFDRDLDDVFGIQREIAREVARHLAVALLPDPPEVRRVVSRSPEAYQQYLRGRYELSTRTADGFRRAMDAFQSAIALDPGYAEAYGGLAAVYSLLGFYSVAPPSQVLPRAQSAARKALELDDRLADAWASLGWATYLLDGDWAAAEAAFERAMTLDPDSSTTHHWRGLALLTLGRFDESLAALETGQHLEPMAAIISANRALALASANRLDEAVAQCRTVLELDSNFHYAQWMLGIASDLQGRSSDAAEALQAAIDRSGGNPSYRASLAFVLARAGRQEEAERMLADLLHDSRHSYIPPFYVALVHAGMGNRDEAFRWLDEAVEERSGSVRFLAVDRRFDHLRADPRFEDLLVRLKLRS